MEIEEPYPWFANLAAVMDEDRPLLHKLGGAYAESTGIDDVERFLAEGLPTEVLRLQLDPESDPIPFRSALWLMYVQAYWGGVAIQEMFNHFGVARGADELGVAEQRDVGPDDVAVIPSLVEPVHAALAGSVDDQIAALDNLLRLGIQWGTLYGVAYTVGFYVPALFAPPIGAKPDHIVADQSMATCAADRVLAIDYRDPIPPFLIAARERQAAVRKADPAGWDAVMAGPPGAKDLREIWREGFEQALYNWGEDSFARWSQDAFDAMMRWNFVFAIPIEAVAHEAITALTTREPAQVRRALEAAALVVPIWFGTAVGIGDGRGQRPINHGAEHFLVT